eukprot:5399075-Prymnesium_polylepis.2
MLLFQHLGCLLEEVSKGAGALIRVFARAPLPSQTCSCPQVSVHAMAYVPFRGQESHVAAQKECRTIYARA